MIRYLLLLLLLPFLLVACKKSDQDEPATPDSCASEPDSLFQTSPYSFFIPFKFPSNDTMVQARIQAMTQDGVELGRYLFYDPVLSMDSTTSCASCHKQALAFSDNVPLSTNVFGTTRRHVPPIFNLLWQRFSFWDGRTRTTEDLVKDALHGEMGFHLKKGEILSRLESNPDYVRRFKKAFGRPCGITEEKIQRALSQFMHALVSANSKFDRFMLGMETLDPEEEAGFEIVRTEKGDCFHCHVKSSNLLMTDNLFHNNALDAVNSVMEFSDKGRGEVTGDTLDFGLFKSPSVRNLSYRAHFMHDGRFSSLDQVLTFYNEQIRYSPTVDPLMKKLNQGGLHLSPDSLQMMKKFLQTLDDPSFINNPAFSNPF